MHYQKTIQDNIYKLLQEKYLYMVVIKKHYQNKNKGKDFIEKVLII
jgi:hypothetical protein